MSRDGREVARDPSLTASRFGAEAAGRLRLAFTRSRHPMLISDNQRRCVTANLPACELLGVAAVDVAWYSLDHFVPASEREQFHTEWTEFLQMGAVEGVYPLLLPNHGPVQVEFSATANVLPGRHLSVLIAPGQTEDTASVLAPWTSIRNDDTPRRPLTSREREVMTLVASGLQSADIAAQLVLSPETVKSHVHNAMARLGAHTRAHAIAIALVTGQIAWET